ELLGHGELLLTARAKNHALSRSHLGVRLLAANEVRDALPQRVILHDEKHSAAAVLAAAALVSIERPLLVQVPEYCEIPVAVRRDPDLCVIAAHAGGAEKAERGAIPVPRRRDLHGARCGQALIPAADL